MESSEAGEMDDKVDDRCAELGEQTLLDALDDVGGERCDVMEIAVSDSTSSE